MGVENEGEGGRDAVRWAFSDNGLRSSTYELCDLQSRAARHLGSLLRYSAIYGFSKW